MSRRMSSIYIFGEFSMGREPFDSFPWAKAKCKQHIVSRVHRPERSISLMAMRSNEHFSSPGELSHHHVVDKE